MLEEEDCDEEIYLYEKLNDQPAGFVSNTESEVSDLMLTFQQNKG